MNENLSGQNIVGLLGTLGKPEKTEKTIKGDKDKSSHATSAKIPLVSSIE